jgi:hypothetical protein
MTQQQLDIKALKELKAMLLQTENTLNYKLEKTLVPGVKLANLYVDWANVGMNPIAVAHLFLKQFNQVIDRDGGGFRKSLGRLNSEEKIYIRTWDNDLQAFENFFIEKDKNGLTLYSAVQDYKIVKL